MSETLTVHPFTSFLVKQLETIYVGYATGDLYNAWRIMRSCIRTLRPDHVQAASELLGKLDHAIESVERVTGLTAVDRTEKQIKLERELDKGFDKQFSQLVWDGGYLSHEAYEFHDPSKGRKSGI